MTQIAIKIRSNGTFPNWRHCRTARFTNCGYTEQRRQVKPGRKELVTRNVWESIYFKRGIALSGYHFDFSDILKRYFVKQHGSIHEYLAIDKTALRSILYGRIEDYL